jgi:hypothetical protein
MKAIQITSTGGPDVLALEDAASAHRELESRRSTGKLVLCVRS